MASYKGHLVGGVAAFCLTYSMYSIVCFPPPTSALELFLICIFGSLFPDIDTKSKIQLLLYRVIMLAFILLLLLGYTYTIIIGGFIFLLPLIVPHRSLFHNKWFISTLVLATALTGCYYIPHACQQIAQASLFFVVGVYSHLALDFGLRRLFLKA